MIKLQLVAGNIPANIMHEAFFILFLERDVALWSIRSWCIRSSDWSFMVEALSYFFIPASAPQLGYKGCGMYYPVCGMVDLIDPLLLIKKSSPCSGDSRKEGRSVLFNDTLNTFYLWLYGVRHILKYHTYSERGNPLLPHRLFFPISSKGSFICIIPQTG